MLLRGRLPLGLLAGGKRRIHDEIGVAGDSAPIGMSIIIVRLCFTIQVMLPIGTSFSGTAGSRRQHVVTSSSRFPGFLNIKKSSYTAYVQTGVCWTS